MEQYSFLSRVQYFQTLAEAAARAKPGEHLLVATMSFSPRSPEMATVVRAFADAAKRGVRISLIVDAITLLANDHGFPRPSFSLETFKTTREPIATRYRALETLRAAGVNCCIINVPRRRVGLIQTGRSHIKCAVIGGDVFIGGCNLAQPRQIDVMMRWHDETAASVLTSWLLRIVDTGQTRQALGDVDVQSQLDDRTNLLLDAGVPGQSLIYEEALALIDDAEEWIYLTCQYFPGGQTAKHLAAAQARGVNVTLNYSHPRAHNYSALLHHAHHFVQRRRRLPAVLFKGRLDKQLPKLHAKVLASDKAILIGSHNYVQQGVNFGTAELALKSTDPKFCQALVQFVQGLVQDARSVYTE